VLDRLIDRFAVVLVAVAAMLWGTDTLFRAPLLAHLSSNRLQQSVQLVFMEHLILVIACLPLLWRARQELRRLNATQWWSIAAIGVGASALATVLFTISFGYGHFIETLLLQKAQPLFAILLAAIWLRERISSQAVVWVPIALIGAYLIVIPDPLHPEQAWADFSVLAGLFALAAAALWGSATVFGRFALANVRFTTLTALRFTFGLPALAIVLLLVGGLAGFTQYRPSDLPLYLGLALLPGGLGLLLYYRGLASTPASLATLAELAFPITGVLVNLYLVTPRQSITSWQVAGIVILWVALAALDYANARQPARLQPEPLPA
jgi:drug/metabolite transporter (DMT)-like permease